MAGAGASRTISREHLEGDGSPLDWAPLPLCQHHDKYYTVSRTVESWLEQLLVHTGPEADERRTKALPLWREDPSRNPDTLLNGPDHAIDETLRKRFFGEE